MVLKQSHMRVHIPVALMAVAAVMMLPGDAHAGGTLGDMIKNIGNSTSSLTDLVSFLAYLIGVLFAGIGVYKLKNHVEFGPQSVPLADPLKMLFAGGLMLSIPSISRVVQATFGDSGAAQDTTWSAADDSASGAQLDGMMIKFMENVHAPLELFFVFFCYIAGAALLLIAIHRFTKTAQDGPRGPAGLGTVATFVLSGVLFSIAPSVGMLTETLFGSRDSMTNVEFLALEGSLGDANGHAQNVVISILAFMMIVGILSIIRGFFVLRGVAEGNQQMTMMSGISHLVAGAILVNFGQFANIIQTTLGITEYGLQFN